MRTIFLNNSFLRLLIFFLCMSGIIVYGLFIYNKSLEESLAATASETLTEIIIQQKFNFKTEINSELFALRSFAVLFEHHPPEQETVLKTMRELAANKNFEYITIANTHGIALSSNGSIIDISHTEAFLKAMQGKTFVGEPVPSPVRDAVIVPLSTPIYTAGKIDGVLIGSYNITRLNELLLPSFSGRGYAFVVNPSGKIISDTANVELANGDNLFLKLKDAVFEKPASFTSFLDIISKGGIGSVIYKFENKKYLAQFEPLGINDWYIFAVIPEKIIAANATLITRKAALLTFTVVGAFTLFILYTLLLQLKSEKMRKNYLDKLERLAFIDDLTGFNNFNRFKQIASDILHANTQSRFVFSKFDIDGFTLLNEQLGFAEGDKILKNTALAINSIINNKTETFARIHADQFVVMYDYVSVEHLNQTRQKFEKNFILLTQNEVAAAIKFPTGRYFVEPGETDIQQIFEKVNYAHRLAKQSPEKLICHYDFKLMQAALYEKEVESKMNAALANSDFKVFLQPKYRLCDETVVGAEALVRWQNTDGSIIRPADFIPLFEKNGFITQLDMYMFENVCKLIKNWLDTNRHPVTVSVNFSRLHLQNTDFVRQIYSIAQKYAVPRSFLEIELTESTMFNNEIVLENVLIQLHEAGFSLSMDDFGTGYSSLGLLKNLPIDVIKFDRKFFINANSQVRAKTVISNVMRMAHELGIYTVAEGVETKEYIDFLRELGCDSVQGYYYAAPMPAEKFSA